MPRDGYITLTVRKTNNGSRVTLKCVEEIAHYYGWLEAFGRRGGAFAEDSEEPREPHRGHGGRGGAYYRISEHPSRHRRIPGKTHRFRLSRHATDRDLLAVLAATTKPWAWVERPSGSVIHNYALRRVGTD